MGSGATGSWGFGRRRSQPGSLSGAVPGRTRSSSPGVPAGAVAVWRHQRAHVWSFRETCVSSTAAIEADESKLLTVSHSGSALRLEIRLVRAACSRPPGTAYAPVAGHKHWASVGSFINGPLAPRASTPFGDPETFVQDLISAVGEERGGQRVE